MISLKTHNDMVERMIEQQTKLQNENKELLIKVTKMEAGKATEGLKDKQSGKRIKQEQLKTNKIQKEYKDKLQALNKAVLTKDLQIQQLKERLQIKLNIDEKEKDHIIQTFRKFQGRKPNSSNDYKFLSVINHYESQLQKRDRMLDKFKIDYQNEKELNKSLKRQLIDKQNNSLASNAQQVIKECEEVDLEINKQMQKNAIKLLNKQMIKKDKHISSLQKQIVDLKLRYQQVLKDYYKLMNEYGEVGKINNAKSKPVLKKKEDVVEIERIQNLSYSLTTHKTEKVQKSYTLAFEQLEDRSLIQQSTRYSQILNKLVSIYNIDSIEEIIETAIKLNSRVKHMQKLEYYLNIIKESLQRIFNRKINLNKLEEILRILESELKQGFANQDLIQQMEVRLGAKRNHFMRQIDKLKDENQKYYQSLKTMTFTKQCVMSNQIKEFIEFFDLDPSKSLPNQILQLYQQLKSLEKFTSICNQLLQTKLNIPDCLQYVLKVLETMKRQKYNDGDLILQLQKEMQVESYQLLSKIKQLKKK